MLINPGTFKIYFTIVTDSFSKYDQHEAENKSINPGCVTKDGKQSNGRNLLLIYNVCWSKAKYYVCLARPNRHVEYCL